MPSRRSSAATWLSTVNGETTGGALDLHELAVDAVDAGRLRDLPAAPTGAR